MGESPRDHTVMVRVDEKTSKQLDSWVEIGAVKSRSEAAALFIREGLQMRADELAELEEALQKLKPEHRDVIIKSRIEKLSAKEIGVELDRSENAVHLLLGRALKSLAQHLKF